MHIVLVRLTVRPEGAEEFERALVHNAKESVAKDPGCLRFDVSQEYDDPSKWILYEIYDTPDAHAAHRQSPHFLAFADVMARTVLERTAIKARGRHLTEERREP